MPVKPFSRFLSFLFRIGEVAFAAVVAGVVGHYLREWSDCHGCEKGRYIYTEVIAALSLFFGVILLIPFTSSVVAWHLDLLLSLAWFAAFGLLVDALGDIGNCGSPWDWSGLASNTDDCSRWKAAEAFSFLSAIFWLASAILGIYYIWSVGGSGRTSQRRYWYGRYDV